MKSRALDKLQEHFPVGDSERIDSVHVHRIDWRALRVMEPPVVEHIRQRYDLGTERDLHFLMADEFPRGDAILLHRGIPYEWNQRERLPHVPYTTSDLPAVEHAPLSELDAWRLEWLRFLEPTAHLREGGWLDGEPDPETMIDAARVMMEADLPFDVVELSYFREDYTATVPDLEHPTPEDRTRTPADLTPPPADGDWIKWARDGRAVYEWMPLPEDRPATVTACAHKLLRTGIGDAAAVQRFFE